jgi:hypothetical protein
MSDVLRDTLTTIAHAKVSAHVLALIVTVVGAFASVYLHDPHIQHWIQTHWWANDFYHAVLVCGPAVLVYYKAEKRAA